MSGIEMYVGKSQSQASSVSAMCKSKTAGYKQLQTAINGFINNSPGLTGQTYNSAKSYFSAVLLPLVKGAELLTEAVDEACKKFPEQYVSEVDSADLKESELEQKIQQANRLIQQSKNAYDNLNRLDLPANIKAPMMSTAALTQMFQKTAKDELEKKLQKLRAFDASSPAIFSEISALEQAVKQGAAQAGKSWNSGTGTFTIPSDAEMGWAKSIEQRRFAKEYGIERPAGMSDKEYEVYLTKMQAQEKDLRVKDGWDKSAIKAYFQEANKQTKDLSAANAMKKVEEMYGQTRLAGSDLFIQMWNAWDTGTQFDAERKLNVLLNIVQVTSTLPNDPKAVADLLSRFDKKLAPDNKFWRDLANEVQKAFPEPNPLSGEFGKQINNLRYVISAQQAQYVRDNFKGATDQEKLAKFLSGCKEEEYDLWESDRLHLKKGNYGQGDWPDGYEGGNIKIVVDFNSEFILNGKGRFQNVIDPEGASENGVVNGASFNYANKNDYNSKKKNDPKSVHGRLDVNIGEVDPEWREQTIDNKGKRYTPPKKKEYRDSSNDALYNANGRSAKQNSDEHKKKLEKEIARIKENSKE